VVAPDGRVLLATGDWVGLRLALGEPLVLHTGTGVSAPVTVAAAWPGAAQQATGTVALPHAARTILGDDGAAANVVVRPAPRPLPPATTVVVALQEDGAAIDDVEAARRLLMSPAYTASVHQQLGKASLALWAGIGHVSLTRPPVHRRIVAVGTTVVEVAALGRTWSVRVHALEVPDHVPVEVAIVVAGAHVAWAHPAPTPTTTTPVAAEDALGGLPTQLATVLEAVRSALHTPEAFTALGLRPPRGMLLHGPPGTGKTLLARTVGRSVGCPVLVLNGPEIVSKYYGETEVKVRPATTPTPPRHRKQSF
jgi:hypothetical protein